MERLAAADAAIGAIEPTMRAGRLAGLAGLSAEIAGIAGLAGIGDHVTLRADDGREVAAEIVGFRDGLARAMPFGPLDGLGPGRPARLAGARANGRTLAVGEGWLGRVIDPLGRPLDGRGPLPQGGAPRPVRAAPPAAASRARLGARLSLGVRVLDLFTTCRRGQRLGLFAASGVGKSTLMAMLARRAECDVAVVALVGERGREVREFVEDELGPEGLARSVVVVATSDATPLLRRQAAYAATAIAEHFRDRGRDVLLMMDSVTRFCAALREIALAAGEPPAMRGFPPSVFAELPRLLERAGPGPEAEPDGVRPGRITGLYTVLVDGDDHDEPVADAVRGTLDGHVVLERAIAEAGRYPAVNVLRSLSRAVPGCNDAGENALVARARRVLALQADMADLIRLGAYRGGTDPAVDEAVRLAPRIEAVMRQDRAEQATLADAFAALRAALEGTDIGA